MTLKLHILFLAVVLTPTSLSAQSPKVDIKAEEAALRTLIEKAELGPATSDQIFWSGALKRPRVGSQPAEPFPAVSNGKRQNQKVATKLQRLDVSASGDMAWAYVNQTVDLDMGTPLRHMTFETAGLEVWKKVNGQWQNAAAFLRPLDREFAPFAPAAPK